MVIAAALIGIRRKVTPDIIRQLLNQSIHLFRSSNISLASTGRVVTNLICPSSAATLAPTSQWIKNEGGKEFTLVVSDGDDGKKMQFSDKIEPFEPALITTTLRQRNTTTIPERNDNDRESPGPEQSST